MDCSDDMADATDMENEVEHGSITIVHTTGVFRHQIHWCHCSHAPERHIQLFRDGLFPASIKSPKTVFTFEVLDEFYIDSMECKTAAMSFFQKLRRLTNNANPFTVPVSLSKIIIFIRNEMPVPQDRYRELLRVSRLWRNLMALKRFGVGYHENQEPKIGSLALFCPACPQPGVNLPEDWQMDSDKLVFI